MPISATNLLLEERTVKDENNFVFLNLPIIPNMGDIQRLIIVTEFHHNQNSNQFHVHHIAIFHVVYCHFQELKELQGQGNIAVKGTIGNRDLGY